MPVQRGSSVEFPPFRLDLANHELWRGGDRLALRPKPFAVLAYLATHAERLVPRAELTQAVWPDTHVGEGLLRGYVRDLRDVLGDDPAAPRFIETVARLGYRFLAPVRIAEAPAVGSGPSRRAEPQPADLVGRRAELEELEHRLTLAMDGARQVVFVTGEAGIGKTTLVDAFVTGSAASREVWTARGQCVEHFGASEAYLPLLEAVGNLGRLPQCCDVVPIFVRHAPTWLVQMPALIGDSELENVQQRAQGATRERMLREFAEGVEVLAAVRPIVLVLEDLQWSDDSTLDLLSALAQRRGTARLLVLCTYRPAAMRAGAHPLAAIKEALQLHGRCTELALPSLGVGEVQAYLAGRFPQQELAPDVAPAVHQATEGNPLFVANLVDYWVAQSVLARQDDTWTLASQRGSGVPDTLRQLIERQLDGLVPEMRHLLDAASVVGREFSTATVSAALGESQDRVDERCQTLAGRSLFLRPRGIEDLAGGAIADRYEFVHALYRQVLYERLPSARRVRLHRRIGEWEEVAYGTRAQEHAAELAVHFERGEDHRAVQHLEWAAKNAMRKHAYREATTLLRRAVDLFGGLPDAAARGQEELSLQMALGTALVMTRGYAAPEVERAFTRARELSRHMEGSFELLFALAGLFRFFFSRARFQEARELGDQVMRLAETHDLPLLAVAHGMVGLPLLSVAELEPAREHLERSIGLYDLEQHRSIALEHGDDPALIALAFLSIALWFLGYPDQALKRSREAQALAGRLAAPYSIAFARSFSAWVHVRRGEAAPAGACAEALMALAAEQGFTFLLAEAAVFRGWALAQTGQAEIGIEVIRQGLSGHRAAGLELGRPSHLALLAEACAQGQRWDEGLAALDEAMATVGETGECAYEADLYRLRGELLLRKAEQTGRRSGLEKQAEAALREAVAIARRQGAKAFELRAVLALCRLPQAPRAQAEALRQLGEVYARFTEGFETADLSAARTLLASAS